MNLMKRAAENLLEAGGFKLRSREKEGKEEEEEEDFWIHFTTKNSKKGSEIGAKLKVLCGPVVNSETKMKETQITPEEYRKLHRRDLEAKSEQKTQERQILDTLVETNVVFSLLQVKSSQGICLNLNQKCKDSRETGSKGGAFLQYNSARLAGIRKKHDQTAAQGLYPQLPSLDNVDLSRLTEPEEWRLVFNFLLEFPSLIERLAGEMAKGICNIHQICHFLSKMCSLFSVYYRRVRILLEPRDHLLQIIYARLLLARCVEQVLENGLAILNINRIEEM